MNTAAFFRVRRQALEELPLEAGTPNALATFAPQV